MIITVDRQIVLFKSPLKRQVFKEICSMVGILLFFIKVKFGWSSCKVWVDQQIAGTWNRGVGNKVILDTFRIVSILFIFTVNRMFYYYHIH